MINRKICQKNDRLAGHRINDEPWTLVVSSGLAAQNFDSGEEKNYGGTFRNFVVWFLPCASSCFSSHVSPARPWPRP